MKVILSRTAVSQEKLEISIYPTTTRYLNGLSKYEVSDTSLKAYCYSKRQFRIFKLANILSAGPLRKRMGA